MLERIGNDSLLLTLALPSVSPEDSGQYLCSPSNMAPVSASLHVVIGNLKSLFCCRRSIYFFIDCRSCSHFLYPFFPPFSLAFDLIINRWCHVLGECVFYLFFVVVWPNSCSLLLIYRQDWMQEPWHKILLLIQVNIRLRCNMAIMDVGVRPMTIFWGSYWVLSLHCCQSFPSAIGGVFTYSLDWARGHWVLNYPCCRHALSTE